MGAVETLRGCLFHVAAGIPFSFSVLIKNSEGQPFFCCCCLMLLFCSYCTSSVPSFFFFRFVLWYSLLRTFISFDLDASIYRSKCIDESFTLSISIYRVICISTSYYIFSNLYEYMYIYIYIYLHFSTKWREWTEWS